MEQKPSAKHPRFTVDREEEGAFSFGKALPAGYLACARFGIFYKHEMKWKAIHIG
jgi:hypothetical protein